MDRIRIHLFDLNLSECFNFSFFGTRTSLSICEEKDVWVTVCLSAVVTSVSYLFDGVFNCTIDISSTSWSKLIDDISHNLLVTLGHAGKWHFGLLFVIEQYQRESIVVSHCQNDAFNCVFDKIHETVPKIDVFGLSVVDSCT